MAFARRVITKTLDLLNLQRHNDNFADIETDLTEHRGRISTAENNINTLDGRVDNIVASSGESNLEIVDAREDYDTLRERLNTEHGAVSAQLAEKAEQADLAEAAAQVSALQTSKMNAATTNISAFQINKNLGKFDQTYMSDEFLQQMLGNTPLNTVPADETITPKKLTFKAVSGEVGKNLFDSGDITQNSYLDADNGSTFALSGFFVSSFIKISSSTPYVVSPLYGGTRVSFYDANKAYISRAADGIRTFVTPSDAFFLRISTDHDFLFTLQVELGTVATGYEEYSIKLQPDSIVSVPGDKLDKRSVGIAKLSDVEFSKNMFNSAEAIRGSYIIWNTGAVGGNAGYFRSDYIEVEPNTQYSRSYSDQMAFYTSDKTYISGLDSTHSQSFTTPAGCKYVRVSAPIANIYSYQLELGAVSTAYEDYYYKLPYLRVDSESSEQTENIYTFNDAWVEWLQGNKFPIAFFGDSTVDGLRTTGFVANNLGIDSTSVNAFPQKLEGLLRSATNNDVLRVYNAGFSGTGIEWAVTVLEQEFGGTTPYNDVRMLGIGFGINDRDRYTNERLYRINFKNYVRIIIEWCLPRFIQPFLVTTQAVVEPGVKEEYEGDLKMRTGGHIDTIANEVKRELAIEYNLELIEMNKLTEKFMQYSTHSLSTLIQDRLHFGDVGHAYEAGVAFSEICPLTITVQDNKKIDYSTQRVAESIPEDWLTLPASPADGFKCYVNHTKPDTTDKKVFSVWIFIDTQRQMTLKAYKSALESLTYVKVDGVSTTLSGLESNLGQLDLGLHRLEVYSGVSTKADFKGFIIE